MISTIKSLVSASLVYGLGTLASKFIAFFLLPIFTRTLSPADYGLFETLNVLLLLLATIGALGMDSAIIRFYFDSDKPEDRTRVVSSAFWLALVASALIAGSGLLAAGGINEVLFPGADRKILVQLTLVTVVLAVVNTVQLALLQTRREAAKYSFMTLVRFFLLYGISVWLLLRGKSVLGVLEAQVVAYVVSLCIGFWFARKELRPALAPPLAKEMLAFSLPLIAGSVSMWLLSSSDRFFLLRLSTLNELGLYSLGSRFASIIQLVVLAFQMAWPPVALSLARQENAPATHARILTYYFFVGVMMVLAVTLFTPELLALLATNRYAGASSVVFLLSCSFLFQGCFFVSSIILSITKKSLSIFPIAIPPLVVSIALNAYLVPRLGGFGSAIASSTAYLLMATLSFVFAHRLSAIPYEWKRIAKMVVAAAAVLGVSSLIPASSFWTTVLIKLILIAGYVGILFVTGFFLADEVAFVKRRLLVRITGTTEG